MLALMKCYVASFGMLIPGRKYDAGSDYRYGFNGKENDDETGWQDYGMRIYDTRLVKFLSVDPLCNEYPWNSTYAFAENDVLQNIDLDGAEKFPYKHPSKYPVLGKVSRYTTKAGNDASTYWIQDGKEKYLISCVTVYQEWKDALGRVHHFNNYYFVQDKALVNVNNVSTGVGSSVQTKGTNWHLYLSDKQGSSSEFNVSMDGVDALGIGTFAAALTVAALPTLPFAWQGYVYISPFLMTLQGIEGTGYAAEESVATSRASSGNASFVIEDEALVVRGGTCEAPKFANGSGVTINAEGKLNGISVNSANGQTVNTLSSNIKNNQIGVTTAGNVRQVGGNVIPSPTKNNSNHATLNGVTPQTAEKLFTPTIPKPSSSKPN